MVHHILGDYVKGGFQHQDQNLRRPEHRWQKSEALAVGAVAGAGEQLAGAAGDRTGEGRGWDCSSAADIVLEEDSSSAVPALAFLHGRWTWWAAGEDPAGECASLASTSAAEAAGAGGRRTWRIAVCSCAGAG